jgi:hypothetical protein
LERIERTGKPLLLDVNFADPRMLGMASPFRFATLEERKTEKPEESDFFASAFKQKKFEPPPSASSQDRTTVHLLANNRENLGSERFLLGKK